MITLSTIPRMYPESCRVRNQSQNEEHDTRMRPWEGPNSLSRSTVRPIFDFSPRALSVAICVLEAPIADRLSVTLSMPAAAFIVFATFKQGRSTERMCI